MAGKLRVSRLLGGDGKAFLGEYDTLGDYGKLGNVYSEDGGLKDSPLAGGMLEVAVVGGDIFRIANPIPAYVPPPTEAPIAVSGGEGPASGPTGDPSGDGGSGPGGGTGGPGSGDGSGDP